MKLFDLSNRLDNVEHQLDMLYDKLNGIVDNYMTSNEMRDYCNLQLKNMVINNSQNNDYAPCYKKKADQLFEELDCNGIGSFIFESENGEQYRIDTFFNAGTPEELNQEVGYKIQNSLKKDNPIYAIQSISTLYTPVTTAWGNEEIVSQGKGPKRWYNGYFYDDSVEKYEIGTIYVRDKFIRYVEISDYKNADQSKMRELSDAPILSETTIGVGK